MSITSTFKNFKNWTLFQLGIRRPQVSVIVVAFNQDNKVLLGMRINSSIGGGCWQFCGGHLEYGETICKCAIRETFEETNLLVQDVNILTVSNNLYPKQRKHYVNVWVTGVISDPKDLKLMEPDKCKEWKWFSPDELPTPMFEPLPVEILKLIQSKRK